VNPFNLILCITCVEYGFLMIMILKTVWRQCTGCAINQKHESIIVECGKQKQKTIIYYKEMTNREHRVNKCVGEILVLFDLSH